MMLFLLLAACSGGTDETTDTAATADTAPVEETAVVHTADTGDTWPRDLEGDRVDPPAPPMGFFVAEDVDGNGKGPADLYDGTPTLLTYLTRSGSSNSAEALSNLAPSTAPLDAAGITWVVVTHESYTGNAQWVQSLGYGDLPLWADLDNEIRTHYTGYDALYGAPSSMLMDADGNVVLKYAGIHDDDDHFRTVAEDATILWGAR